MYKYIIYKLTFSNRKVYIGQTIQEFNYYMNRYKRDSQNKNRKDYNRLLYRAIRKYGWDNVKKEILFTVPEEFVDELETKMIVEYKSANKKFGYNLESGGHKNKTFKHSKKTKQLMRKSHLGLKHSEESKLKIGLKHKNKIVSKKTKEKQSIVKRGKPSLSIKSINVYIKTDGEYVKTFDSIKQASEKLNVFATSISAVLNNRLKSAGGFIFKYNN